MSYTNALNETFQTELAAEYHQYISLRAYRRDWMRTGDWHGPVSLHPLGGDESMQSRGHNDSGKLQAFDSVYRGEKVSDCQLSSLEHAGLYMPDINLHKGFDNVCRIARDTLKRELVKSERKPLFAAYVKACNKYQLVCLPDQTAMPFNICGGTVWEATGGRMARFCTLVEKALGRFLTRKEGVFIRSQWPAITAVKRARIRDQSHTNVIKDDQIIYTTEGKKINQKIHSLLDAVHGYSGAVSKLRKMLSNGAIDHEFYNDRLAVLRKNRDKALEILKEDGYIDKRLAYGNGRVMHNSKGLSPEVSPTKSKVYAQDSYSVLPDETRNIVQPHSPETETEKAWRILNGQKKK